MSDRSSRLYILGLLRLAKGHSVQLRCRCNAQWCRDLQRLSGDSLIKRLRYVIRWAPLRAIVAAYNRGILSGRRVLICVFEELQRRHVLEMPCVQGLVGEIKSYRQFYDEAAEEEEEALVEATRAVEKEEEEEEEALVEASRAVEEEEALAHQGNLNHGTSGFRHQPEDAGAFSATMSSISDVTEMLSNNPSVASAYRRARAAEADGAIAGPSHRNHEQDRGLDRAAVEDNNALSMSEDDIILHENQLGEYHMDRYLEDERIDDAQIIAGCFDPWFQHLMASDSGSGGNKKLAEALLTSASQVESLTPQLVNAGRIRMTYPESKAADVHFENLRQQYAETIQRARALCDEATDSADFVRTSEEQMQKHSFLCEEAIAKTHQQKMVDNTAAIARLANRVILVAIQESDNSEDPAFIQRVNQSADVLQHNVAPMVQDAKAVAMNISDGPSISHWRESNRALLGSVGQVRKALVLHPEQQRSPDLSQLRINHGKVPIIPRHTYFVDKEIAPPRPPLPGGEVPPPRPPPPETDDEDEMFMHAPQSNQPIMMAAHGLHQEVRQWSSKDNEIIAAAKKMAILMARLSGLVRGEGGNKRDLIACAKAIAEASQEVTRLAKELARECTDKRIRTNLLQVCERIPTIGTQLKILSTVKATMLGAQGTEEDQEATEMLVGNAQNLMQSVKETVRAAECASIKIRTASGMKLRWVRRQPWYQ